MPVIQNIKLAWSSVFGRLTLSPASLCVRAARNPRGVAPSFSPSKNVSWHAVEGRLPIVCPDSKDPLSQDNSLLKRGWRSGSAVKTSETH